MRCFSSEVRVVGERLARPKSKTAMSEFNVLKTVLGRQDKETIEAIDGPNVSFVTKGNSRMTAKGKSYEVKEGFVYFIGQGVETSYMATNSWSSIEHSRSRRKGGSLRHPEQACSLRKESTSRALTWK